MNFLFTFIAAVVSQVPLDGTVITIQTYHTRGYRFTDRFVERLSGGPMMHSAIVLNGYVYEATPPCVKRTPWSSWTWMPRKQNHHTWLMQPKVPFTPEEVAKMTAYADSQLGRRYMARGLWQQRETSGTFCSKYVSEILEVTGRVTSARYSETPTTLYNKLFNDTLITSDPRRCFVN